MMRDVPTILIGEQADDTFGHLVQRDPEEMRRQNADAFKRIDDIFAQQGSLLVSLFRKAGER